LTKRTTGIDGMPEGFAQTCIGAGHTQKGLPCQDASGFARCGRFAAAAVSDGHGGRQYFRSRRGAQLAVKIALQNLMRVMERHDLSALPPHAWERLLRRLERSIAWQWKRAVARDVRSHPPDARERELCRSLGLDRRQALEWYGATLLAAGMTEHCAFALQIGDGRCILVRNGGAGFLLREDERLGCGMTTSLCGANACADFRHAWIRGGNDLQSASIFLMTDGVSDCYAPDSLLAFSAKLQDALKKDRQQALSHLDAWLPVLSDRGSRDDMSIASIYRGAHEGSIADAQAKRRRKRRRCRFIIQQQIIRTVLLY